MITVIGVDPSLTCTALVRVVVDGNGNLCESPSWSHRLEAEADLMGMRRLRWLRDQFADRTRHAQLFVFEGYSFGSRNSRAHSLGELGGLLRMAAWETFRSVVIVPPATLKKFVTGKGTAPKEIVLREVHKKWGYDAKDNNDADAYALARFGARWVNERILKLSSTQVFAALADGCEFMLRGKDGNPDVHVGPEKRKTRRIA